MPTQPKPYRDIDDLIAAMRLPKEQALTEIKHIAAKAGEPLFTGYDMRDPLPRRRKPVDPAEFFDPRLGQDGPYGKYGLVLRPAFIWVDLKLTDEAYRKVLEAWRQWLAPVAEGRNMWLGDSSLRAARAGATQPQEPSADLVVQPAAKRKRKSGRKAIDDPAEMAAARKLVAAGQNNWAAAQEAAWERYPNKDDDQRKRLAARLYDKLRKGGEIYGN